MTSPMVQELFKEINKVQAVKLVDLPGEGATDAHNAILSVAVDDLRAYAAPGPTAVRMTPAAHTPHACS